MLDVRTITVSIDRDWRAVYDFASIPENFAKWASGLGKLERNGAAGGDGWIAHTPEGVAMPLRFAAPNAHGVLDHWLSPPQGGEIYLPLRVIANGAGCTVMFTLPRQPGVSDATFAADADWVARDLARLKEMMEA
jgi:hypothetical protein